MVENASSFSSVDFFSQKPSLKFDVTGWFTMEASQMETGWFHVAMATSLLGFSLQKGDRPKETCCRTPFVFFFKVFHGKKNGKKKVDLQPRNLT